MRLRLDIPNIPVVRNLVVASDPLRIVDRDDVRAVAERLPYQEHSGQPKPPKLCFAVLPGDSAVVPDLRVERCGGESIARSLPQMINEHVDASAPANIFPADRQHPALSLLED